MRQTNRIRETSSTARTEQPRERALLVHVRLPSAAGTERDELEELRLLAESAGAQVAGSIVGTRQKPDPATFVGKGKAEEIRAAVSQHGINLVLVDHALSPAQERNLEKAVSCRVLDRTGLILGIFAQRARSHEGKLQVELAQLEHLATRLVRGWTHLERQKGGIGLKGPGETQLETDRRLIGERIKTLSRRLQKVRMQRGQRRKARKRIPIPTVSLVGYTNAGKSSLFNRLTGASVYAADRLFATLDPTMRRISLPGNADIILADTVGFIRHIPHDLVEAFHATLEEVSEADLLIHVVDANHPERQEYMDQVNVVLGEIEAEDIPQIIVYNKIDLTGEVPRFEPDALGRITKVWLSAQSGEGIDLLLEALSMHFRRHRELRRVRLPPEAGRLRANIYERLEVVQEHSIADGSCFLDLRIDDRGVSWLEHREDFNQQWWVDEVTVLAPARAAP